jgi:multidrug efflux pump subunit AcrB
MNALIEWMVRNPVTPNLFMLVLIIGGLAAGMRVTQEVFPDFVLDRVQVNVTYDGAGPDDIEKGILLAIEDAIAGLDGVKRITSRARDGGGSVWVELRAGSDRRAAANDIQTAIDDISSFPEGTEPPIAKVAARRREVLEVDLFGEVSRRALFDAAEDLRITLLADPGISQVEIENRQELEIAVELSPDQLRAHGLTVDQVANAIRHSSALVPAGTVTTADGDIALRFDALRDEVATLRAVPLLTSAVGTEVQLGDIARIEERFADLRRETFYNGVPAISIEVFRVGAETPNSVSAATHAVLDDAALPAGIGWVINQDGSKVFKQRLDLLLRNAGWGLALVLIMLTLFLDARLAFWVAAGIFTVFTGTLLLMPVLSLSINLVSMFAFIVALGIVVDDAIVVGENIHAHRRVTSDGAVAAVRGVQEVFTPVVFAVLTNIVAFMPLLFLPGWFGKIWAVIPLMVSIAFTLSLLEALFILPAHLRHGGGGRDNRRRWANMGMRWLVLKFYKPTLETCLRYRYPTLAFGSVAVLLTVGLLQGGRVATEFFPEIESDRAEVNVTMPPGSSLLERRVVRDRLDAAARAVIADNGGDVVATGVASWIQGDRINMNVYLADSDVRVLGAKDFNRAWRAAAGPSPEAQAVVFVSDGGGPGSGKALTLRLTHPDNKVLRAAADALKEEFAAFPALTDIESSFETGGRELEVELTAQGRALGLTVEEVGRQLRAAVSGVVAQTLQRGRDEITVRVRLPEDDRSRLGRVLGLPIRLADGQQVPLDAVATVTDGRASASIRREDGARIVSVSANTSDPRGLGGVRRTLNDTVAPALERAYPRLSVGAGGRQRDRAETEASLQFSALLAMIGVYALLAIALQSYALPLVVMIAIPLGLVGAVLGHLLMNYPVSVVSQLGMVALAGVVVNDSLILVDSARRRALRTGDVFTAIRNAAIRRVRPIVLTTITTFGGLAPMIFETSRQAQFVIPMAISLGYGLLFTTIFILLVVPCVFLVVKDADRAAQWLLRREPLLPSAGAV